MFTHRKIALATLFAVLAAPAVVAAPVDDVFTDLSRTAPRSAMPSLPITAVLGRTVFDDLHDTAPVKTDEVAVGSFNGE